MIIKTVTRRALIHSAALSLVPLSASAKAIVELQAGDPDGPSEKLEFETTVLDNMLAGNRASFEPKLHDFRDRLIAEASSWVGKNRSNSKDEISRLLALFNLAFDHNKVPTPYCAAGVSFVAAMVYARQKHPKEEISLSMLRNYVPEVDKYHFYPTPNVEGMHLVSRAKDNWMPRVNKDDVLTTPKPGWLILFQWEGGQNHVGLVEKVHRNHIETIEFNTSPEGVAGSQRQGGEVARRSRAYPSKFVRGFIST